MSWKWGLYFGFWYTKIYCEGFFGIKIQFEEMEAALPHKQLTLLKLLTLHDCLHSGIYAYIKLLFGDPTKRFNVIWSGRVRTQWDGIDRIICPRLLRIPEHLSCFFNNLYELFTWTSYYPGVMLYFNFCFILPLSKFNFRWLKVRTNRPELTLMNWLGARLAKSETVHRMKLTIF